MIMYHWSSIGGLQVLEPQVGRVHDDVLEGQRVLYLAADPAHAVVHAGRLDQLDDPEQVGHVYVVDADENLVFDAWGDKVEFYTFNSMKVIKEDTDKFSELVKKYWPMMYQSLMEQSMKQK